MYILGLRIVLLAKLQSSTYKASPPLYFQYITNKIIFLDGFQLQCRVVNKPYDIFGTWYSDQYLFSGDLHWLAHYVSCSILWLNKASQEAESELVPITHNLCRFYNRNASSIRAIMVANCLPNSENVDTKNEAEMAQENVREKRSFEHGNPVSHHDINRISCSTQTGIYFSLFIDN